MSASIVPPAAPGLVDIVQELREQEWEVALSSKGDQWTCIPPGPHDKTVYVRASPDNVTLVIRDLRAQGFKWPPPNREPPPERPKSTPFAAKPHPDASTGRPLALVPAAPPEPSVPPAPAPARALPPAPGDEDRLFADLKEHRALAAMANDNVADHEAKVAACEAALDKAKTALAAATIERDRFVETLRKKKAAFDRAFSGDA